MYDLSQLAASTWRATTEKARHIYLVVVQPAVSYRAALWHNPQEKPLKGLAGKLAEH